MNRVLEKALKKVSDAELFIIKVEKYPVSFSGNRLKSIKSSMTKGIGLRVNYKGRLGFSSDSDEGDPESLISRAMASAVHGPECEFEFCKNHEITPVDLFDPRTVSFEIEEAVEMGEKMIDHVVNSAPDTVNDLKITKFFIEVSYFADGVEKTYYKTLLTRQMSSLRVTPEGFIYISEEDASCRIPEDTLAPSRRIIEKIPLTQFSFEMPSRPTTVIFHPKSVGNLIEPLTAGLSGINLLSGMSPLVGKYNRWILDQRFSLADDPTIALAYGSEGFDGDGLPRKRMMLFDRGVLSNYLLDMYTASKLKMEPNACAQRGPDSPPAPGTTNLVVSSGDAPLKDMISSIKDGIIVEEVIGGGQSNTIGGEFSVNVSLGFKVENGEVKGRVRNTMISGNVYELLKNNLVALSTEVETHNSITTPYFMFRDLSVAGKGSG
mgnify:CR=1 FL=1